jgi:deoxyribodipyrimidine photo-lyase
MRAAVWFKKDLRTKNNPALYYACQAAEDGVVGIYLIDYEMWKQHQTANCQIEFIFRGLEKLKSSLNALGLPLLILETKKTAELPSLLAKLAEELKLDKLFFNRELELNENRRDAAVTAYLEKKGLAVQSYEDQLILPYNQFYAERESYFKIFTPFKRHWLKQFKIPENIALLGKPKPKHQLKLASSPLPTVRPEFRSSLAPTLWPAGEDAATIKLKTFLEKNLFSYDSARDFPAQNATSQLSPYLNVGMISAQECFVEALKANHFELDSGNRGALTWLSELIWRDFYRHILLAVPRVCRNQAYKIETEKLAWNDDPKLLQAWQEGRTGFPLVDAAMRQLNTLGWMHNRLRMVTAMFLSKNLLLDWRLGETYFTQKLIDQDFASNNGGWQWSASTGTDAVPYFRLFNPTTQSERFDPEGAFIRHYCPELKALDNKAIHAPYLRAAKLAEQSGYPRPIIDYGASRLRCLAAFKALKKSS